MSKYTAEQCERRAWHLENAGILDVAGMLRAYAACLREREAAKSGVTELPDNIRVPLDEVRADLGYLFGRVAADGSFMQAAVDSCLLKLDALRAALTAVWPVAGKVEVPEGWHEFLLDCAKSAGGMVNGNHLAERAKLMLSAAPTPPASEGRV